MHCEQGVVDERYETVDIGSQRVATSLLQNSRVTTHHYRQKARNKILLLGPYAKHCLSCYFQTKVELRRRSVYVRMQNDVLTLVGRLRSN